MQSRRVLLDQLLVPQPVKKSPTFSGTRKFVTMFTTVRHFPYPEPVNPVNKFAPYFTYLLTYLLTN
jgi:hypothetical protein